MVHYYFYNLYNGWSLHLDSFKIFQCFSFNSIIGEASLNKLFFNFAQLLKTKEVHRKTFLILFRILTSELIHSVVAFHYIFCKYLSYQHYSVQGHGVLVIHRLSPIHHHYSPRLEYSKKLPTSTESTNEQQIRSVHHQLRNLGTLFRIYDNLVFRYELGQYLFSIVLSRQPLCSTMAMTFYISDNETYIFPSKCTT